MQRPGAHGPPPLLVALFLGALGPPVSAQEGGEVRGARLDVELAGRGGEALVRVDYEVIPPSDGRVPLTLLEHAGSTGAEVSTADGAPVRLEPASGTMRSGSLEVDGVRGAAVRLSFTYTVPGAVRHDGASYVARVPVLGVSLPPTAQGTDVFTVAVRTPPAWSVSDGFPSGLRATAVGRLEATLPVVPSMVGLRGRTDGAWRPGVDLMVELATLLVLTAFVLLGWRRLRTVVAAGEGE